MDYTKAAPLVLRFSRQRFRRPASVYAARISHYRPLSTSTSRRATPLPPSPEHVNNPTGLNQQSAHEASGQLPIKDVPRAPPKRSLRPLIWATGFILVGVTLNAVMRAIVFPPPLPEPDSEEDAALVSMIKSDLNNLPLIAELRKDREAWREYDPYSQREAFMSGSSQGEAEVDRHLTAGSMRGARGVAVQRSFYNAAEKREISILFFGGAVSGWPGVTHGGVLMTVLKEAIERAANGPVFASRPEDGEAPLLPGQSLSDRRKRLDCDTLTLNYKRPTQANSFYVIRAEVQMTDPSRPGHTHVKASLENALTAKVCVNADGYCTRGDTVGTVQNAASNTVGGVWSGIAGVLGGAT